MLILTDSIHQLKSRKSSRNANKFKTSEDSYVIKQGNLVEVGGVLNIQTTPVTKGTGTEGTHRVNLADHHFSKILNVQATAEDTPVGSIHENAHIGSVGNDGFVVYVTSTHTAPVDLKVRYFVRAIA